ncbi:uncharacterized protein LOC111899794 [Lactuca sativa]|uniref:uncharacterized protein LOC111899794 n=1 Tax=Lactuca sativa TaxID=4236 RepID=UPI000CD91A59|nr:uncharacterized protein LOC111899794 [Lactuca sativa]
MFTSSIARPPLILSTLPHRLPPPHHLREVVFGSDSDGRRFHTLHHQCSFQVSGPFRPKVGFAQGFRKEDESHHLIGIIFQTVMKYAVYTLEIRIVGDEDISSQFLLFSFSYSSF